jgi:5-methylcytosine-specific restriction protein A
MGRLTTLKPRLQTLGALGPKACGWADTRRTSATERGYGYPWQKLRAKILKRDCYLCQACDRAGRVRIANIVDHIVGKEDWKHEHDGDLDGCDDPSNLEAICKPCHTVKTAAEAARARARATPLVALR